RTTPGATAGRSARRIGGHRDDGRRLRPARCGRWPREGATELIARSGDGARLPYIVTRSSTQSATSAAPIQRISCSTKRRNGPTRWRHSASMVTTQTPHATAQATTRATSRPTHPSRASGSSTSVTVISTQTIVVASRKPGPTGDRRVDLIVRAAVRSNGPGARIRFYNLPVQPPASLKALSDPIYEAFYGLTEQ